MEDTHIIGERLIAGDLRRLGPEDLHILVDLEADLMAALDAI